MERGEEVGCGAERSGEGGEEQAEDGEVLEMPAERGVDGIGSYSEVVERGEVGG